MVVSLLGSLTIEISVNALTSESVHLKYRVPLWAFPELPEPRGRFRSSGSKGTEMNRAPVHQVCVLIPVEGVDSCRRYFTCCVSPSPHLPASLAAWQGLALPETRDEETCACLRGMAHPEFSTTAQATPAFLSLPCWGMEGQSGGCFQRQWFCVSLRNSFLF